ncbi:hypothetical protein [Pseudomonas sp. WHRI 8519]|uniref:hypothetical protein n=1 Tax=Pseudomonas sp. WHRI 8519 TaxID=3162567 RepID=UPI0032EF7448
MSDKNCGTLNVDLDNSKVISDGESNPNIDTTPRKNSKIQDGARDDYIKEISRLEILVEELKRDNARVKAEYQECSEEKRLLSVELESSRATSIERKDKIRVLQVEVNSKSMILESMKSQVEAYILSQQQQQESLIKLESQLELLKELFLRD